MKRTQLACLLAACIAFSPLAFADKPAQESLATIEGGGCTFGQHPELAALAAVKLD
jgi:hypothetical protein